MGNKSERHKAKHTKRETKWETHGRQGSSRFQISPKGKKKGEGAIPPACFKSFKPNSFLLFRTVGEWKTSTRQVGGKREAIETQLGDDKEIII